MGQKLNEVNVGEQKIEFGAKLIGKIIRTLNYYSSMSHIHDENGKFKSTEESAPSHITDGEVMIENGFMAKNCLDEIVKHIDPKKNESPTSELSEVNENTVPTM